MKKLFVSDFDGTLTTADSMMAIIIFRHGKLGLALELLRIMPWLVLMAAHLYPNQRTKERLLHNCFGKMTEKEFDAFCQRFADSHKHILRNTLHRRLTEEQEKGNEVVVVTASPEKWVSRLVPEFKVLGTKMEFRNGSFTGRFLSPNCYGAEKVRRLIHEYPDLKNQRDGHHIIAFGDSRGDRELLRFADEGHLIKH
ncbi:MAG: haloacid dehalogenase-like hydrolase [Bacteroidales bacterium]|nr:haloacid dehalogenase-like hydrolase [Bacteroidales bacterium]MCM1146911.1 haloacid dehalogenase-like hydrolase [Bacteroidales bacterium]MCM1205591.1 haloacid dehalogenase-like hydrolase [Bacillota bacterium]MCM1510298.1 haloacid dehalogenase-like hydrolase [Clostridium sp.]